jgi:hypothetical protein
MRRAARRQFKPAGAPENSGVHRRRPTTPGAIVFRGLRNNHHARPHVPCRHIFPKPLNPPKINPDFGGFWRVLELKFAALHESIFPKKIGNDPRK